MFKKIILQDLTDKTSNLGSIIDSTFIQLMNHP